MNIHQLLAWYGTLNQEQRAAFQLIVELFQVVGYGQLQSWRMAYDCLFDASVH